MSQPTVENVRDFVETVFDLPSDLTVTQNGNMISVVSQRGGVNCAISTAYSDTWDSLLEQNIVSQIGED